IHHSFPALFIYIFRKAIRTNFIHRYSPPATCPAICSFPFADTPWPLPPDRDRCPRRLAGSDGASAHEILPPPAARRCSESGEDSDRRRRSTPRFGCLSPCGYDGRTLRSSPPVPGETATPDIRRPLPPACLLPYGE